MRLKSTRLTVIASAIRQLIASFSPNEFFTNAEQGVWYDPGDYNRYMQTGPELAKNGNFSNGAVEWIIGPGWVVSTNGAAKTDTANTSIGQEITAEIDKFYIVEVAISTPSTQNGIRFSIEGATFDGGNIGIIKCVFTAKSVNPIIYINGQTFPGGVIRSVSIKELIAIDTCTLFQDSAGTTPVTAVEQPVGLMLDKRLGLVRGVEITPQPLNFTTGWAQVSLSAVTANSFTTASSGGVRLLSVLTVGRRYEVVLTIENTVTVNIFANTNLFGFAAGAARSIRLTFVADGTNLYFRNSNAGTTTITNISVRELPGNHAFQITAPDRPILRNRYNLLTETEFRNGVADAPSRSGLVSATTLAGYAGALAFGYDGVTSSHAYKTGAAVGSTTYTIQVVVEMTDGLAPAFGSSSGSNAANDFGLVVGVGVVNPRTYVVNPLGGNTYRVTATHTTPTTPANSRVGVIKYLSNSNRTFKVTAYDLRLAGESVNIPRYQRVNTATDYDSDPAKFPLYLACNGVNTWMQTNNIDFTGTDKVTVFVGVRKLSAQTGIVAELGNSSQNAFWFGAPGNSINDDVFMVVGSVAQSVRRNIAAPVSAVYSARADILGQSLSGRANGVAMPTLSGTNLGTGNFGNYPLYLFRRGGTSLPLNGNFYGLIIRGALTSQVQIELTERWMAKRTGITLP